MSKRDRHRIAVKLTLIAANPGLEGKGYIIHYSRPKMQVALTSLATENDPSGRPRKDALCVITGVRSADPGVYKAFLSNAVISPKNESPNPACPDRSRLPQHLQAYLKSVEAEFKDYALRNLGLFRWFTNSPGPQHLIRRQQSFECRVGKRVLFYTPPITFSGLRVRVTNSVDADLVTTVGMLFRAGYQEPLAHDLLQEAESISNDSPRSSLVIAIAAAEIGFKEAVADLVPDARWLVQNMPAPPLHTMLTDYLPSLPLRGHLKGRSIKVPPAILGTLRKGITIRNTLVHKEPANVSSDTLVDILEAVRELLYFLDACRGHDWALFRFYRSKSVQELKSIVGPYPQQIVIRRAPKKA